MKTRDFIKVPFNGSLDSAVDIERDIVNRCPQCRTPFCVGNLAPGTKIEVECKRSKCKGRFIVVAV